MRQSPLPQSLQCVVDGLTHGADLVREPGAQYGRELHALFMCDGLQHAEFDLPVNVLQARPNTLRLFSSSPVRQPRQHLLGPHSVSVLLS